MLGSGATSTRRRPRAAARLRALLPWALLLPLAAGCGLSKRVDRTGRSPVTDPAGPVASAGPVALRVALGEGLPAQSITCAGAFRLVSAGDRRLIVQVDAGDTVSVRRLPGGVAYTVGAQEGRLDELVAESADDEHFLAWGGRPWRGALHVIASPREAGALTVLNVVELEDYLAGVVPLEIGRGRSARERAAVEAQAIAARTYAVARLEARRSRGFDLYADTRDQVYGGAAAEDAAASAAVRATAGLILRGGELPASAFFHANCGGHTAAKEAVWPVDPDPLLRGVRDTRPDGRPWCADGGGARWQQRWSWTEFEAMLQRSLPLYLDHVATSARSRWAADAFRPAAAGGDGRRPGALRSLRVAETSPDGRVRLIEFVTESGVYRVRGGRIRWVLRRGDDALLHSTLFQLDVDSGRGVTATGRGHGHGLGLCQDGALARARAGQSAREILMHYYPGAKLGSIGESGLP